MEPYAERHLQQSPAELTNEIRSPHDLASWHDRFTKYCLWLETQGSVSLGGEEHLPMSSPSLPGPAKNGARGSSFSNNSDKLFAPDFDGDVLNSFAIPFSLAAPTSNDMSSSTAYSDKDEAMADLLLDDFAAEQPDAFSGFLPELRDLDISLPKSSSISDGAHLQWTAQDQGCPSPGICCFALANKTLKALHIPSTACLSTMGKASFISSRSRPNTSRTAGSVLTGNREAMLALSRMLRCSCSLKTQLQLVIATICDKLVAWYHAMVQQSEQSSFGATTTTLPTTTYPKLGGGGGKDGRRRERVLCQPITIGDYCLDGAAEAQITGRVVLTHLQGMDLLVAALSRRIKDANFKSSSYRHGEVEQQHSSPLSDEGGLLRIIRDRLVTYLIGHLQGAREEAARLMNE